METETNFLFDYNNEEHLKSFEVTASERLSTAFMMHYFRNREKVYKKSLEYANYKYATDPVYREKKLKNRMRSYHKRKERVLNE